MDLSSSTLSKLLNEDLWGYSGKVKSPYPGIPVRDYAKLALEAAYLKKYSDEADSILADSACLAKFLQYNERCRTFSLDRSTLSMVEDIALNEAKNFIERYFFHGPNLNLTYAAIADRFGVGPGASIGAESNDFFSKLATSTLSTTDPLLTILYRQAISRHPTWNAMESLRSSSREVEIVRGSKLSFVPKTTEISRSICTEPLLNMLFQKGIGRLLEEALQSSTGINLSLQPSKNQELARLGSLNNEWSTIDLSSASDSISISLVREFFPTEVVNWLMRTRSPCTLLPSGELVDLHMISSMGNAFTFPLQTMIFSALVVGAYRVLDIPISFPRGRALGNFGVFGDDIIVKRKAFRFVCRLLHLCGFDVNHDKSFEEGLFRESCGSDYLDGANVRGVYVKTLKTVQDKYSAINRLNRWSARWGIPLPNTVGRLMREVKYLPIPRDIADDAGIKVPLSLARRSLRPGKNGLMYYTYLQTREISYDVHSAKSLRKLPGFIQNDPGLLLAAVAGYLRDGKITHRMRSKSAFNSRGCTPRWDYDPYARAEMHESNRSSHNHGNVCWSGDDWEVTTLLNLGKI